MKWWESNVVQTIWGMICLCLFLGGLFGFVVFMGAVMGAR